MDKVGCAKCIEEMVREEIRLVEAISILKMLLVDSSSAVFKFCEVEILGYLAFVIAHQPLSYRRRQALGLVGEIIEPDQYYFGLGSRVTFTVPIEHLA